MACTGRQEWRRAINERPLSTLVDCLVEAAGTPGFVKLCNALTGYHLTPQSAPDSADARAFVTLISRGSSQQHDLCRTTHIVPGWTAWRVATARPEKGRQGMSSLTTELAEMLSTVQRPGDYYTTGTTDDSVSELLMPCQMRSPNS